MSSRPVRPTPSSVSGSTSSDIADDRQLAGQDLGNEPTTDVESGGPPVDVVVPSTVPVLPRLFLAPVSPAGSVLRGGWWPHSYDPLTELPGLILALCARYGSVRELCLRTGDWHRPFQRLAVDAGVVNIIWSSGLDPALMIATTGDRHSFGLLVVAPHTDAETAKTAMHMAADPANTRHARDILAGMA